METISIISKITLSGFIIMTIILIKIIIIDLPRFSGFLQKEISKGKQQWFFKNTYGKKLLLSKIYDENNIDTSRLKEGEFYKELISDKFGRFIVPQWSIYQVENGYLSNKKLEDKYLQSFWKFLTR